jgi:hypothetical protein
MLCRNAQSLTRQGDEEHRRALEILGPEMADGISRHPLQGRLAVDS